MTHAITRPSQRPAWRPPAHLLSGGALLLVLAASQAASAATLRVGPGKPYAKPCAALTVAANGDTVEIDGGQTYTGDVCAVTASNLTIRGVNGRPRIDAAGQYAWGKGSWVLAGNNTTVDNVEMLGAKVPDRNGAALRLDGQHLTLRNSYLHDNENGVLTANDGVSNIVIEGCEFAHNGYGDGQSHNVYVGNVASLVFRYNYSHDAVIGHNLKSRAPRNTIAYNRFSTSPAGTAGAGRPSYEIDLPWGGTSYVIGNVLRQTASNDNPGMLAYGMEGAVHPGQNLYVVNNTFINDDPSRGSFLVVGSGVSTPILAQNNIFMGVGTFSFQASTIDRNNLKVPSTQSPMFVDKANYDLRPAPGSPAIDAGAPAGAAPSGVPLDPVEEYVHVAQHRTRVLTGARVDIGAYEAAGTQSTMLNRADCLLNWAERTYPTMLWPTAPTQVDGLGYHRNYTGTNSYVVVSVAERRVYGLFNGQMTQLGALVPLLASTGCN